VWWSSRRATRPDFPSVTGILNPSGNAVAASASGLVSVFHHLSDVSPDSPLASLIREAGVVHLLRQAQQEQAEHTAKLLGVVNLTTAIQKLNKGEHILLEGGQPEVRPPRVVCHVRTDLDRWTNDTDGAITGGSDAPASPFPGDHPSATEVVGAFTPAPDADDLDDATSWTRKRSPHDTAQPVRRPVRDDPTVVWVVLGGALLIWVVVMYLRIFGGPAAGTVQEQRDRSSQWARSRADVEELLMTGPDSRRLPMGTLITTSRKSKP